MYLPQILAQVNLAQTSPLMMAAVVFLAIVALAIAIKVTIFIIRVVFILLFLALVGGAIMHLMNYH
jgi:hypothetical protein